MWTLWEAGDAYVASTPESQRFKIVFELHKFLGIGNGCLGCAREGSQEPQVDR